MDKKLKQRLFTLSEILMKITAFLAGIHAKNFFMSYCFFQNMASLRPATIHQTIIAPVSMSQVHESLMMVFPAINESLLTSQLVFSNNLSAVTVFLHERHQFLTADASMSAGCGRGA
jgi:hypothetical protein